MSFMNAGEPPNEFIDTNVLVYAFDSSAGEKQITAQALVNRLLDGSGCLSIQVLQEFFVNMTRKISLPLSIAEVASLVQDLSSWKVFAPTADDVLAAIALSQQAQLNFWDAMILHSAAASKCGVLWSEDLNDGQTVLGVEIRNPFTT
jgi:predicted nucleic acid-binding protein